MKLLSTLNILAIVEYFAVSLCYLVYSSFSEE